MNPPIFVINLDECQSRWHKTDNQLKQLNLSAERFPATRGSALPPDEIAKFYDESLNDKRHHRPLTCGEIGCYISHLRVWQHIEKKGIKYAVVLEDDINVDNSLVDVLTHLPSIVPNWDLIKLADNRANPFYQSAPMGESLEIGNYKKVPNCANAYILSQQGAKKLLQRQPFFRPVDVDIQFHSEVDLQIVGIKPYPVSENLEFDSEISKDNRGRHSNHSTFFKNIKFRTRMYIERQKPSSLSIT